MCWCEDSQSNAWRKLRWQFFLSSFFLRSSSSCEFRPLSHLRLFTRVIPFPVCSEGKYQLLENNNLQIQYVTKADEGVYRCEASVEARGEIDFVDIAVLVNGKLQLKLLLRKCRWKVGLNIEVFWTFRVS